MVRLVPPERKVAKPMARVHRRGPEGRYGSSYRGCVRGHHIVELVKRVGDEFRGLFGTRSLDFGVVEARSILLAEMSFGIARSSSIEAPW